jgi:hypothetical protein
MKTLLRVYILTPGLLLATCIVFLCDCGSDSAPPGADVSGVWSGTVNGTGGHASSILALTMSGADVSGGVALLSSNDNVGVWLNGSLHGMDLALHADASGGSARFAGTVTSAFTASGTYESTASGSVVGGSGTWEATRLPVLSATVTTAFSVTAEIDAMAFDGTQLWLAGYPLGGSASFGVCAFSLSGVQGTCYANRRCDSLEFAGGQLLCNGVVINGVGSGSSSGGSGFCISGYDGDRWCLQEPKRLIHQLPDGSDELLAVPLIYPNGLAWDGASLWGIDRFPGSLVRLDALGAVTGSASLPHSSSSYDSFSSITWDGAHLVIARHVIQASGYQSDVLFVTPSQQ